MQNLTLISHPLCPYVQRAAIALLEKNLAFQRIDIDLAAKPDWFLALSPLGKTPVLQTNDGAVFESAVILEYLEDTTSPALHPKDPLTRARHRGWIAFSGEVLNDIAGLYSAADDAGLNARAASLTAKFTTLEAELSEGPWFGGRQFSLVDAAFAPVFRYFDLLDGMAGLHILSGLPAIALWRRALAARPSVQSAVSADYNTRLLAFFRARNSRLGQIARDFTAKVPPLPRAIAPGFA